LRNFGWLAGWHLQVCKNIYFYYSCLLEKKLCVYIKHTPALERNYEDKEEEQ